jgi:glucosylceramidase
MINSSIRGRHRRNKLSKPARKQWFQTACLWLQWVAWMAGANGLPAQSVSVWMTTDDQSQKLQSEAAVAFVATNAGSNPIIVDEGQTFQPVEGFGASFTDTTGYALNELATALTRNQAMTNLFTRDGGGIGLSFVRNPMGASDLSRSVYSYDDLPSGQTDTNLAYFSIAHDQADILPLLQQARQLNPQLKFMANPWSPPGWMKDSGSMIGGSLLPAMYGPFANYFVKYVQAYQAAGIPIHYLSLQNEPLYVPTDYPGMAMDAATQIVVLRDYLLPALAANHLTNTQVLIYDHNWDQPGYPNTVLSDATLSASAQVSGIAWHGYAGTPGVMLAAAGTFPAKGNYLTEHSGGDWISDPVRSDFEEIIHVMRCWGRSYVKWNLAADPDDGPHTGGCGNCRPLIFVNPTNHSVSYSIEYYTLGHFSKFVLPGARRIYSGNGDGIITAAFKNPDGSKVLVAYNDTADSNAFQVQWGGQSFAYALAGYAGATFTWTGTPNGGYVVKATHLIQASSFNSSTNLQTEASADTQGGYDLGYVSNDSYAAYQNVDFASGFTNVVGRLASAGNGGTLELHLDAPTGPRLGTLPIPVTGGWQTWQSVTNAVAGGGGQHALYAVFKGSSSIGNLNWLQFSGAVPPLPAPWSVRDVGPVGLAGSVALGDGVFSISGSGDDIWNSADAFCFLNQPVSGCAEIRAQVLSLQPTDPWAKAGVAIRESTASGAINAAVVTTPNNGVSFQVRSATGGATTATITGSGTLQAPVWLRLARTEDNYFSADYSTDGSNWLQVGSPTFVMMNRNAYAGLAVTAHNNATKGLATLGHVTVNQAPVLAALANQTLLAGRTLLITNQAADADVPPQTLGYSLLNAPAGAVINASNGLLAWRPAMAQSASTQSVGVVVADDGVPGMMATQFFNASILRPANPTLSGLSIAPGQFGFFVNGDAGPDYLIQTSTNLSSWTSIATSTPAVMPFGWRATNTVSFPRQFYRARLGP